MSINNKNENENENEYYNGTQLSDLFDTLLIQTEDKKTSIKMKRLYSNFKSSNSLQYKSQPERDDAFTVHNENIESAYIPTATFKFNLISIHDYSTLIQIFNTPGFYLTYYDYELLKTVTRFVYSSNIRTGDLVTGGNKIVYGIRDFQVTVVSKKGYINYDSLKKGD